MESSAAQQIFDQLSRTNKVLVALPKTLQADTLSSALALSLFLNKLNKEVDMVSQGDIPESLKFLPGAGSIKKTLDSDKSLVVVLNTAEKELEELSYQTLPGQVQIFLKPKDGRFSPEDVTFQSEKEPYSLVFILGCASLEDLGEIFERNTQVFFEAVKINIDHHANNQYFGSLNLVDITASSTAEILASLFERYETQIIDEDIATCLLTGIIAKTNSFQHVLTTPKTFLKASELINMGGRQQEIVKHLYKTKPLSLLRLWGRALARLKTRHDLSLVYSQLNVSDFEKSEALASELPQVLTEMTESVNSFKVVAVIAEEDAGQIRVLVSLHQQFQPQILIDNIHAISSSVAPQNSVFQMVNISLPDTTLTEAENLLLNAVGKLPGLHKNA